ncbi:hypothetical protein LOAG_18044 [Loa loa]|nr:hypothetical protein LOAG_18044 [Loa loa]EJD74666.1 hypothetical protein LOAG_18044 [Loa loa]
MMQPFLRPTEVPPETLPPGSVGSYSSGNRLVTGTSDDDKPAAVPEGETQAGATALRTSTLNQEEGQPSPFRAGAAPTDETPEKGLVTGEKKKKKKKKSKSKKSKKKKSSKGNKKEGKKSEETLPEEP